MFRGLARQALLLALVALVAGGASAQSSREAERKLETIRKELKSVASERREIESKRGAATRELRKADEQVASSSRALAAIEAELAASEAELAQLQDQRGELETRLGGRRDELARLLRAAYAQGDAAPLKLLLAQDRVADANRLLAYHRYVQRDRAARIDELGRALAELDTVQARIDTRRADLETARERRKAQLAQLQKDRAERKALVAGLDRRFEDRRSREKALGRDAKGLEQLLKKLRAAAAKAEAQRRAAAAAKAEREAREAREAASAGRTAPATPKPAATVATGPSVGGAGWPLAGNLLAGYRAKLPDGRSSDGLLIAAAAGTPVKAVADGTVVYSEWMSGFGLILIIDHGNGYMSLYAHNDALLRDAGDPVKRGEQVATVGSSGGHGRPALYFELRRNGEPVDPGSWLKR
ncbi:peptidase M23 [Lysobacter arseniciresistens ZS79]|uniref:Peptidase M23 n=1 Tax=Lysobacter arseniciresistens ZS79 TaxID=913325 RepID=A0A0A0EW20_9GAMM|nr:peptidoglycan DD-metalloendopeptidase family protein [Lysobacter arseniciresistens]KGM54390.1 peptidase M23 [Lysobacter arseniciresistens ZS79]